MNGKVAVGFCYAQTTQTPQWTRSLRFVYARSAARIVAEYARECSGVHLPRARCEIVRNFLQHPLQPEWLWMVDTDATFPDDILEHLIASADPVARPIMGALAFGVRLPMAGDIPILNAVGAAPMELYPTIFVYDENGTNRIDNYPRNQVVHCHATGAHCLLIHRNVLADPRWTQDGHPQPWFRSSVWSGQEVSEDHFFCIKAGSFGYPVHVDTSAKTGHVKTFVADEDMYLAQTLVPPAVDPVDVIVPVLHRPQNIQPLMDSLKASTSLATVWFVCEPDDVIEQAEVLRNGGNVLVHAGTFAEKVNHALEHTTAPRILLVGDDVIFHQGWLDYAEHTAKTTGAKVVGTNDLGNPRVISGDHATHMLIDSNYIFETGASWDGPGVVCHEGYGHWYVDDEIVTAAKQRGVWAPSTRAIVEHNHPIWGKAEDDDVYKLGQARSGRDGDLFQRRLKASMVPA